ncbi:1783_t:CDS:2, partial [Dentiscutata heterogama]
MNKIQDNELWANDDFETDSEYDINDNNTEAWQYFKLEGNFTVCQVEITQDGKKKNASVGKKEQVTLEQIIEKVKPHNTNKQNELQAACIEWIVLDSLSFNALRGKGFQRFMKKIDPRFKPPSDKGCKNFIVAAYQDGITKLKMQINETCEYATITTDLWTARSKFGYISITIHWLTPNFEIIDTLLTIERMRYPHTAEKINDYINNKIDEFGL